MYLNKVSANQRCEQDYASRVGQQDTIDHVKLTLSLRKLVSRKNCMLGVSGELVNLQLSDMLGAVLLVILGVIDDLATIATLNHYDVKYIAAWFTLLHPSDPVFGELLPQSFIQINLCPLSKLLVGLFLKCTR